METDVLGLALTEVTGQRRAEVVAAHPGPDFENRVPRASHDGMPGRPGPTFGTMNDDVLAPFDAAFRRKDFVQLVRNRPWPE
ncbi:hypothetical protein [Streptomyces hygroscopicus]|uniref:hypothetical protein n=1 Tax=Streptomyces sp. KHY 26 TaxID=3097359 RepID=UPI002557ABC5|nr:hypothetical protein [Streptomyces hygroscopicus]